MLLTRTVILSALFFRRSLAQTATTRGGGMSAETNATVYSAGTHSVAYVTVPSEEVAKTIAKGLVREKLAACVNIIPKVTSIYEWKNEINEDSELLLMIKTRSSRINDLIHYVRSHHPYEVCEVISLPIQSGNEPYLKWIGEIVPPK